MATESYSSIETLKQYYGNATRRGSQIPFNFGLLEIDRNNIVEDIDTTVKSWLENLPENMVANWVVSDLNTRKMIILLNRKYSVVRHLS